VSPAPVAASIPVSEAIAYVGEKLDRQVVLLTLRSLKAMPLLVLFALVNDLYFPWIFPKYIGFRI
jgi:hypothetical protein